MDPEQITQIFCPFCRKGVAIRGAIPDESVCPHCEKNFPTAEFAAPQPTHRTSFVSSHPPGKSLDSVTPPSESKRATFDQKVSATLKGLNRHIPDALFWGVGGLAGVVAPFIDGRNQQVGRVTIFSTLVFLYLWWLRHFGALAHQKGPLHFLSGLGLPWRAGTNTARRVQVQATAGTFLALSCVLLGGINIVTLVDVGVRPFFEVELSGFSWPVRAVGLLLLFVGGVLRVASGRGPHVAPHP